MLLLCQTSHVAHADDLKLGLMIATQQYVLLGLRLWKCVRPFLPVYSVAKGVPGRGLAVFFGVDASTGTLAAGVPSTETKMVAFLIEGFGRGEPGETVGLGDDEPLLQATIASAAAASARSRRFGMGGSLRRLAARTRFTRSYKDESIVAISPRAPHSIRGKAPRPRSRANVPARARWVVRDRRRRTSDNRGRARAAPRVRPHRWNRRAPAPGGVAARTER